MIDCSSDNIANMKIKEFINEFEQIIPVRQAEDFDNVGLLCGNPDREITGILIAHDALENVIDEAIGKKLNFVFFSFSMRKEFDDVSPFWENFIIPS